MSTTDLPGSRLLVGRYRLVERLGAGGMSVVWRGFDEVLGRQVAVKVLPPSTSADPSFRRRLRAEAQAAARLSHPHITNVYDYGEATTADGEAAPYVVMELVDGESLAAVLARVQRMGWPTTVRICAEVSAALAAAHSRGIVHRDVTPANVMLTSAGAKVVDFGISALIGENDIDPDGSLLGTPAYLAPERLEGSQVSPATDVYAVGLMMYRTMIGQLPWDVDTTTALLRAHQYVEPDPLPHVEGLPPAVTALIGRCLEKRPEDRPSSAELAHVLAGVSAGAPEGGRGYVLEWAADSGEDTTILPPQNAFTDGLGRARVAAAGTPQPEPDRGVASVPSERSPVDEPISPAVAGVAPVPTHDVRAAVVGNPVAGNPVAGAPDPQSPAAAVTSPSAAAVLDAPTGPIADPRPAAYAQSPENPPPPPPRRAGGARNSRFGAPPRRPVVPSDAVPMSEVPSAEVTAIRPAFGLDQPADPGHAADDAATAPAVPDKRHRADQKNRRVFIGAGLVMLLAAAVYVWSLTAETPKNAANSMKAPVPPSVVAPEGNCVVSYAVWSDDGSRFRAQLTIANRDEKPIANWRLWFIMNGDQVVSGKVNQGNNVPVSAPRVRLNQQGKEVTLSSAETLSSQSAASVTIDGRYDQSDAAPMAFKLDGRTCETFVSGKPGAPSLPVEHLSNGGVRLGPKPSNKTPVPGISIDANGLAHVRPGVHPTSSASKPAGQPSSQPVVGPSPSGSPTGGGGVPLPDPPPGPSSSDPSSPSSTSPAPPPPPSIAQPDPLDTGPAPPVLPTF